MAVVFIAVAGGAHRRVHVDPAVLALGATCLRVVSYGYAFYAWGMVMVQAFNGAGDTTTPDLDQPGLLLAVPDPAGGGAGPGPGLGPLGVFLAITIAESLVAVVGILAFRRGKWKEQVV